MRILFCCQFYAPSVGGVQEVVRQIAERMVDRGHDVTIATTYLQMRNYATLNGVAIRGFNVAGNWVSGMSGEVRQYQKFVVDTAFDLIMVYAAQQWTFDALCPVLDKLSAIKVLVPCGFSSLYEPRYTKYFEALPNALKYFDHFVFHATEYRDMEFVREHGFKNISVIPNGANEMEFNVGIDPQFRKKHGISQDDFLFLTVGSFTGLKGHTETANAFLKMQVPVGRHAVLMLNGNEVLRLESGIGGLVKKFLNLVRTQGLVHATRQSLKKLSTSKSSPRMLAEKINASGTNKTITITDLCREELIQAYLAADLFVFASNIEYSPLVLFESAAAGTPFLTIDVGNAVEIAKWTAGGEICPSFQDNRGYSRVEADVLATHMASMMNNQSLLSQLGKSGKLNWMDQFTWEKITNRYEDLFIQLQKRKDIDHHQ